MKNVVYLKNFDNGGVYVGITSNFNKRMREHLYDSKNGSNFIVHKAMRKYNHTTSILIECENYEDCKFYEYYIIQNFKELGYLVYNMTNGGDGTVGYKHSSETKEFIRKVHLGRIDSDETKNLKSKRAIENKVWERLPIITGDKHHFAKDFSYYETNAITRANFKARCKTRGWNFDDFKEEFSHTIKENNGKGGFKNKKMFFYYKIKL